MIHTFTFTNIRINKNSKNKSEEVSKSPQNNIQTYFEEDWNETLGQYYNQTPRTIADMKRKEKFLIDKGEYREANALHTEIIKTEMIYQKKRDQMYLKTKSKYVTELKSDKNQINQNREKQRAILEQTVAKMQNKDQQQRRSGPNQVFSRLFLPSLNQDKNSSSPNKPTSTTFRTQVNPETINFTNNSGNVDANVQTNENIQQNENDIVENEAKDQLENDNTKTEDPTKVDDKNKENVNKDSTPGNQESKLNNDPLKAVGEQMVQKMAGEEAIDDKEAGKLINKNDQEADKKLKKKTVVLDPKMINGAKIDDVPSTSNLPVVRVDLASAKDDENGIFSSWMSVDTCNQKPLRLEPVLGVDFPDDDDERASSEDTMDDPLAAILSPLASLEVMQTLDNNAEPISIDSKAKASKKTEENSKNETKTKKKRKRKT